MDMKNKKLDNVLKYLDKIQQPNSFREFDEIKKDFNENKLAYSEFELWIIMDKLCLDKYVSTEAKYINSVKQNIKGQFETTQILNHRFYITYNGKMFISKGGYVCQVRKEFFKTAFQILSTIALAIGTIGLLIWEVLKTINHWT